MKKRPGTAPADLIAAVRSRYLALSVTARERYLRRAYGSAMAGDCPGRCFYLLLIFSFTYCENASAAGESDMLFSFIM